MPRSSAGDMRVVGQLGYEDYVDRGNSPGQMGENLSKVALGTGRAVLEVSAGSFHTCVLLDDTTVKCWGFGSLGQLGSGDFIDLQIGDVYYRGDEPGEMGNNLSAIDLGTGRTAVNVAAAEYHTCAVLDDATLKCWGFGRNGQLGYGDGNRRGDGPGEMGNSLPTVDLGTGRTALQVTAGEFHTCALLDDMTVKCWGYGQFGQLGYGDLHSRGDGPGEMGDELPAVDVGTGHTAVQVSAGRDHTCALLDDATVKCWGKGNGGRLGYGDGNNRGDGPGEMGDNLPSVDLGTGRTTLKVAAGDSHTCALLDDGTVKCWGVGSRGRIGSGDSANRGDRPGEMGDNLPAVDIANTLCGAPVSVLTKSLR